MSLPRDVPASIRWSLRLCNQRAIIGWALIGFGMVFVWLFAVNSDISSLWQFAGKTEKATATITQVEQTDFSEGGRRRAGTSRRSGRRIVAHAYVFTDSSGAQHSGISYGTKANFSAGSKVTAEYPPGRPELSRIIGMRRQPVGPLGAITLIFPAAGLAMALAGFFVGHRAAYLVVNGRLTRGTLRDKRATGAQINNRNVYAMTFEFTTPDGRSHDVVAKTDMPKELHDEAQELILYDPSTPDRAAVVDNLPAEVRVDEKGNVTLRSAKTKWLLLIPALTVVGHGTYAIVQYLL